MEVVHEGRIIGSNETVVTTKPVGTCFLSVLMQQLITVSFSAPSAGPSSVSVVGVTSSTITVMWGSVPCIHQNGDITGYSVQYRAVGSDNKESVETSETEITLSSLMPETEYEISVAALNTEGIGVSTNISATTPAGS